MRKYRWIMFGIILATIGTLFTHAQNNPGGAERAQALLTQAREAAGGEAKFNSIYGLSIKGKRRNPAQAVGEGEEMKVCYFMMHDDNMHFKVDEDINVTTGGPQGAAGEKSTANILIIRKGDHPDGDLPNGPHKRIFIKKIEKNDGSGPESVGAGAGIPRLPGDLGYNMFALMLKPMPETKLNYSGESQDGRFDVIEMTNGLEGKLYLDRSTHLPALLTYRGLAEMPVVFKRKVTDGKEEMIMRQGPLPAQGPEADIELRFSDHRYVDGVMLPFHITKVVNNEVKEEWDIEQYELNPKMQVMHDGKEIN